MNIRLFSAVVIAVGSLALTACTINTTDGSGGAGGTGGTGTSASGSGTGTSTSTSGSSSSGGVGGGGGTGGGAACQTCLEVITPPDGDLNNICATSSDIFNMLNDCVCGTGGMGGMCDMFCTDASMMCFAWGDLPTDCNMCRANMCMNEFNACANDAP
jgi:hypothetical protein